MKRLPQFDLRQYTPSLLARIYEQTVARDLREKVIAVRGIYRDRNKYSGTGKKNPGCYGGFYYDSLVDQITGKKLTLKIPEKLKAELQDGNIYFFRGNIENKLKQSKDISLDFLLVSDQILSEEPCEIDEVRHKEETQLYEKKRLRTGFDVDRTLRQLFHSGKSPRVSILYGNNGIVDSDVETALRGTGNNYLLRNARVSLADKNMIIEKIKKIENYLISLMPYSIQEFPWLRLLDMIRTIRWSSELRIKHFPLLPHSAIIFEKWHWVLGKMGKSRKKSAMISGSKVPGVLFGEFYLLLEYSFCFS